MEDKGPVRYSVDELFKTRPRKRKLEGLEYEYLYDNVYAIYVNGVFVYASNHELEYYEDKDEDVRYILCRFYNGCRPVAIVRANGSSKGCESEAFVVCEGELFSETSLGGMNQTMGNLCKVESRLRH